METFGAIISKMFWPYEMLNLLGCFKPVFTQQCWDENHSARPSQLPLALVIPVAAVLSLSPPAAAFRVLAACFVFSMGHLLSHPVESKNVQRHGDAKQRVGVGQCHSAQQQEQRSAPTLCDDSHTWLGRGDEARGEAARRYESSGTGV